MSGLTLEIERQIPALRRYAWALSRNAENADDLVQDCLERALRAAPNFRSGSNVRPWLFSILHNVFVDERRRLSRRGLHLMLDEVETPPVKASQEASADVQDAFNAIAKLPIEQREVLLLVGVEDLSYEEAARVLCVPVGTIMSRLSRGREKLRELLQMPRTDHLRVVR
jgi:RNA polymerase sigma-70 factor (ECF subfamily)